LGYILVLHFCQQRRNNDTIFCLFIYSNIYFVYFRVAQNLIYFAETFFCTGTGALENIFQLCLFFSTGFRCAIFKTKSVSVAAQCTFHLWLINRNELIRLAWISWFGMWLGIFQKYFPRHLLLGIGFGYPLVALAAIFNRRKVKRNWTEILNVSFRYIRSLFRSNQFEQVASNVLDSNIIDNNNK